MLVLYLNDYIFKVKFLQLSSDSLAHKILIDDPFVGLAFKLVGSALPAAQPQRHQFY